MPDTAIPDTSNRHGIGGNGPPDTLELLRADLREAEGPARARLIAGAHEILLEVALADDQTRATERQLLTDAFGRTPESFETEDIAAKGTNFAARISRAVKAEEEARESVKRPYLEGGRRIDAAFRVRRDPLERFVDALKKRIAMFQRRKADAEAAERRRLEEEQRRALAAAQELERKQREVQEAAAQGAPVDTTVLADDAAQAEALRQQANEAALAATTLAGDAGRLRTDHGALASSKRKLVNVRVVDEAAVPDKYWIIDVACVMAVIRSGGEVPGIEPVWEDTVAIRS